MSKLKVNTITALDGGAPSIPGFEGGGGGSTIQKVALLKEIYPSGTQVDGVAGWNERTLNTKDDPHNLVTLNNSSEFTITAGTYLIEWNVPGSRPNGTQTKLTNVTNGTTESLGRSGNIAYANTASGGIQVDLVGSARISIQVDTTYKIEQFIETAGGNKVGLLGAKGDSGESEVYTQVIITDLAVSGGGGGSGVSSIIAGEGIAVDQATGDVTITNTGGGGGGGGETKAAQQRAAELKGQPIF